MRVFDKNYTSVMFSAVYRSIVSLSALMKPEISGIYQEKLNGSGREWNLTSKMDSFPMIAPSPENVWLKFSGSGTAAMISKMILN